MESDLNKNSFGALYSLRRSEIILPLDFNTKNDKNSLHLAWTLSNEIIRLRETQSTIVTTSKHKNCCWENTQQLIIDDPLAQKYVNYHQSIITYEDGKYKIKDLEGEKNTFINGEQLEIFQSRNLVDGDIISFSLSQNDPIFQSFDHPKILFYIKYNNGTHIPQPNKSEEIKTEVDNSVCQSVFDILLSDILSSLPPSDLKIARMVNSTWKRESCRWFYAKIVKEIPPANKMNSEFLHLDPGFPAHCKNTTIRFQSHHSRSGQYPNDPMGGYNARAISYFERNGHSINVLQIDLNVLDFKILLRILPHLVNLFKLKLTLGAGYIANFPTKFQENVFPKVKSFSIKDNTSKQDWKQYENFFISLLGMFPSLEKLETSNSPYRGSDTDVLHTIKRNPTVLHKIKEFAAPFDNVDFFLMYQALLDLPFQQSLLSLEFSLTPFGTAADEVSTELVTELLRKFSSTLESLSINIGNAENRSPIHIILKYLIPPLRELKTLQFKTFESTKYMGRRRNWLYFGDTLETALDYELIFPKLKTLIFQDPKELDGDPERRYLFDLRLMTTFIQKEGDVNKCLTVTRLGLPKTYLKADDPQNPQYQRWLERITETFPNVHSPAFRAIRDGDFHLLHDGRIADISIRNN